MNSLLINTPRLFQRTLQRSIAKSSFVTHYRQTSLKTTFSPPPCSLYTTSQARIMAASLSADQLATQLQSLGLSEPLTHYKNCYPEANPVDIYRAHITSILTEVTGVDAAIIYPALQWTLTLDKGDLVLPVPALRVKGKKPNELAVEWAEKVHGLLHFMSRPRLMKYTTVPRIPSHRKANRRWHVPSVLFQANKARTDSRPIHP